MIKRIMLLLLAAALAAAGCAGAENSFLDSAETMLRSIADFSEKQVFSLGATGYNPDQCLLSFDFTEGNQTVIAVQGDQCRVFYKFEDHELMSLYFRMIMKFEELEKNIPSGKMLRYQVKFSEEEVYSITRTVIEKYYSWALQ